MKAHLVVGELIGYGLDDAEERVRRDALEAFAGRAGGIAFDPSPARLERWRADRPYLVGLRDRILASLTDRSALAREGAVLAVLNFDSGSSIVEKGTAKLAADSAEILANTFRLSPKALSVRELSSGWPVPRLPAEDANRRMTSRSLRVAWCSRR